MAFILITVVIDMIAIGVIVPVLPVLVGTFTHSQAAQAYWFGVTAFAFGIANFLASPLLGALSDRFGRRPVLLLGFAGLTLSYFVTALATSLWMIIVVRAVSGALSANLTVANAYVADITPPEERARRFGLIGAMFGVGFILGPIMGGLLGHLDLRLPFFVAGGLAVLNALYGFFVLPESLPQTHRKPVRWAHANPLSAVQKLRRLEGLGSLVWVLTLASLAQYMLQNLWVLYCDFKFGWGPKENGLSLFFVGLASATVQGGMLGRMIKRYGVHRLVVLGLTSSAVCYLLWGLAPEGWMMYAIVAFNLFGFGTNSALRAQVSAAADERSQGETLGAASSLISLTAVMAPVISSYVLGLVSHYPRGDWRIGAPFYLCSGLAAVGCVLALQHNQRAARGAVPAANSLH